MVSLERQLEEIRKQESEILGKMDRRNGNKRIECCCGCEDSYRVRELVAIQSHSYNPPYGCTGGDYWSEGELQFVCPETGVVNRLLFDDHDVPYEERRKYENNPDSQFKKNYKRLFMEVEKSHGRSTPNGWVNNYYVDKNRRKFGLVEKRK